MIDLHTHTNVSDGTDSPFELINKAMSQGITTLAITDHDSIDGWQEAERALRPGLQLVKGAEISTLTTDGISVHMLGLLFDGGNEAMITMLNDTKDQRIPRMKKMIELLNRDGITISMDDVMAAAPEGATVGRPHLADALVATGLLKSRDEAFQGLLNNDSKYYVEHVAPTPEEAIRMIKEAGGVSVIAHPFASRRGQIVSVDTFATLVQAGLNGVEVDHRDHNAQERADLLHVTRELNLVATGSSDYHGTGKLNSLGENLTNPAEWERLESMARERRVISK